MTQFYPDRGTYIRTHAIMAVLAMAGAMLVLWISGSADVWTGAIGGLAAIAVRGWYVMDEALADRWEMTADALTRTAGRQVSLPDILRLRNIAGAVQIITHTGDKHLIKYQSDPRAVIAAINAARGVATQD